MITSLADIGIITSIDTSMASIQSKIASLASGNSYGATATPTSTASGSSVSGFASALSGAVGGYSSMLAGSSSRTGVTGSEIVADGERYLGVPYVWGGTDAKTGLDCSGLVQLTFKNLGISLPRTAAEQSHMGVAVPSLAQAQPGDLLTFGDPAHHIGIYVGDNKMLEAPQTGEVVKIADLNRTPTSIRRVVSQDSVSGFEATPNGVSSTGTGVLPAGVSSAVASYAPQFAAAEQKYGLPSGMLAAVAQQESGGNSQAVSPAGAQGLMQLMPSTAAARAVNAFDPGQAIDASAQILSGDLRQFGTVPLALAAYNAGAGAVQKYNGIPPYAETQNYVRSITAMMGRSS